METKTNKKALFEKILPIVILSAIGLIIGISLIGNFYQIDVGSTVVDFRLIDLLRGGTKGIRVSVFFYTNFIILPIFAGILLFFDRFHHNFAFVSLFILLFCAVVSVVGKDVFVYILSHDPKVKCSVEQIYFSSVIPSIGYFVLSALVLSFAINKVQITTRDITESGILIAAALALNFIKLFPAPTGGSVNLQMLPLFFLALRRGPLKGFIGCGIVYGLISCLTDGWGFAFLPFDYLLAFGGASFLGFFSNYILNEKYENYNFVGELFLFIGCFGATIIRFVGGCISSMLFYSYTLVEAMLYNAGYVFISGGLATVILMGLYGPLLKINKIYPPQKA